MKNTAKILFFLILIILNTSSFAQSTTKKTSGNPIFPGWYADPDNAILGNQYWIFPTYSGDTLKTIQQTGLTEQQMTLQKNTINKGYLKQTFLDAFSSPNLVDWQKHPHILDIKDFKWAAYAIWAPAIVKKEDKYFLFFGANDIQNDNQPGGIGVGVATKPEGPYLDYLSKPLVDKFYNGAQPIDQFVFRDTDGKYYLIYGGWRHCNIGQLKPDFTGVIPYADGSLFKSITPDNYVEGPYMIKRRNKYYLMWSEGGWTGPDYSVAYAISDSPMGPFKRVGKILKQDPAIATGAGHHSVMHIPGTDDWYIVYHRRPLGVTNGNHREVCIDKMYFDKDGFIEPVKITMDGVAARTLKRRGK